MSKIATFTLMVFVLIPQLVPAAEETPASSEQKTLAVLAFENSMRNPELDWIGIGFAETITTKLARVHGIRVVERRQIERAFAELQLSMSGAVDPSTAQQVGKFVGAQYNLIGSFQKLDTPTESHVMINARLMKTETAEIFETAMERGKYEELFDLQERLALRISKILQVPLSKEEIQNLAAQETNSLGAYKFYYMAKQTSDLEEKITLYQQAIELDPQYAYALANLGSILYVKGLDGDEDNLRRGEELCRRAIESDPLFPDSYYILGNIYSKLDEKEKATQYLKQYIQIGTDSEKLMRARKRLTDLEKDQP